MGFRGVYQVRQNIERYPIRSCSSSSNSINYTVKQVAFFVLIMDKQWLVLNNSGSAICLLIQFIKGQVNEN